MKSVTLSETLFKSTTNRRRLEINIPKLIAKITSNREFEKSILDSILVCLEHIGR